jgi:hypothetical protein
MQLATPLERTVAMICKIITKDGKMFPILIEILKMTDNQEIVQMLENNLQNEAASRLGFQWTFVSSCLLFKMQQLLIANCS